MKALVLWFGIITFFTLSTGCDTSETVPTDVNLDDPPTIELRVTHDRIIGSQGDQHSVTITAIVRNADGLAVPEVIIRFIIRDPEAWKGTIAVADGDSVTDQNGEVTAIYSVVLERSGDVVIESRFGSVSSTSIIHLFLTYDILPFYIQAPPVLRVPPGQTIQTPVTAILIDNSGIGVPDALIHFRVGTPTLGYFDSDTGMTDVNGRAVRTFNTIANQYGTCMIYARFGSLEVSASIEIIPAANPCFILLFTDLQGPFIGVYPNQNVQVEIIAVVLDIGRNRVPVDVHFEIIPYLPGGDIFGSLDPLLGRGTTFSSLGGYGKLLIRGSCFDYFENVIADSMWLDFRLIQDQIGDLILSVEPDSLFLHRNSVGVADITARVIDIDNKGLENIIVNFSSMYCLLWRVTPTDSVGYASAEYRIYPQTDFPGDETEVVDTITAVIRGTDFEAQVQIYITVLPE